MAESTSERFPFPGIPSGWFMVGRSPELAPRAVLTRRYFDQDIVLYRTQSGAFRATTAYCPHLGAHMGQGRVVSEAIRCRFHGFEFDGSGHCLRTPYAGGRPPKRARLAHFPVAEHDGLLLVYHDALGRDPTWSAPRLDLIDHTPFRWHRFEVASHPQETSENSVDFGHFAEVHGFEHPRARGGLSEDGPVLRCQYSFERPLALARLKTRSLTAHFDTHVYGLGYSLVETRVPSLGLEAHMLINATPIDAGRIHLHVGVAIKRLRVPGATALLHRLVMNGLLEEVGTDVPIWNAKRYEPRPALAAGDGDIARYRRWAAQFQAPTTG